jgi:hypothetical protein
VIVVSEAAEISLSSLYFVGGALAECHRIGTV